MNNTYRATTPTDPYAQTSTQHKATSLSHAHTFLIYEYVYTHAHIHISKTPTGEAPPPQIVWAGL